MIKLENLVGCTSAKLRIKNISYRRSDGIGYVTEIYLGKKLIGQEASHYDFDDEDISKSKNDCGKLTQYLADEIRKAGYEVVVGSSEMKITRK